MTVTAGPAQRVVAAFCTLAGHVWLAGDKVRCEPHGGRFDAPEVKRHGLNAAALRAGCLAVADARADDYGAVILDLRLIAAVIGPRTAKGEPRGAQAARIAARVAFELARPQREGKYALWPRACFSAAELDKSYDGRPRGPDIGDPREIRAANTYSGALDNDAVAIWTVTWLQEFRARPEDFAIELPEPAGIPDEVLSARAPEIGAPHRDDYDRVVPQEQD